MASSLDGGLLWVRSMDINIQISYIYYLNGRIVGFAKFGNFGEFVVLVLLEGLLVCFLIGF